MSKKLKVHYHWNPRNGGSWFIPLCGRETRHVSKYKSKITCKDCLRLLGKIRKGGEQ